jgi:hypothetical protein
MTSRRAVFRTLRKLRPLANRCGDVVGLGATAWLLSALGLPPHIQGHRDLLTVSVQDPVPSIPTANRISAWEHLDDQHVMLRVGPAPEYLITLKSRCPGLSWTRDVAVTMSNHTIWAGFDAIIVAGTQCEIETINPLGSR